MKYSLLAGGWRSAGSEQMRHGGSGSGREWQEEVGETARNMADQRALVSQIVNRDLGRASKARSIMRMARN